MKRILSLTSVAAILISIGSARAHAQTPTFKVPFNFTVQEQLLPAGTYRLSYVDPNSHFIQIHSLDSRINLFMATIPSSRNDSASSDGCKLVFARYGDQHFLHQVLCGAMPMNAELPTSRLEKRTRFQFAHLHQSQTTVAALRIGEK